jgi:hypothetical protein
MTGRLRRLLSRHCSIATMERLVDPILTDIHVEAAKAGQWASLRIHCAGVTALVKALAFYGWIRFWRFGEWSVEIVVLLFEHSSTQPSSQLRRFHC